MRVVHRRAGEHYAVRARLFQHFLGVRPCEDAAVGDYGDIDRIFRRGDLRVVGLARVHHVARAAVHGEHVRPRALAHLRELCGKRLAPFQPDAEFDGDLFAALFARGDNFLRARHIRQQRAPLAVFEHLRHGAAHVDVDDSEILQVLALACLAQDVGVAAEQLRRRLRFAFVLIQELARRLVAQLAEGKVGIPRQRRA